MKVWVIMIGNGLYPIGYEGGTPGYLCKKTAKESLSIFSKNAPRRKPSLHLSPITAAKNVLESLGIRPYPRPNTVKR